MAAAAASAINDTKAAIQPPGEEACRRSFSGYIGIPRRDVTRGHDLLVDRHGGGPLAPDVGCWTWLHEASGRVDDSNPVLVDSESALASDLALHRGLLSWAQTSQSPA